MTRLSLFARMSVLPGLALLVCGGLTPVFSQGLAAATTPAARLAVANSARPPTRTAAAKQPSNGARRNRPMVRVRARAGDTLNVMADRFGVTAEEIARLNGIVATARVEPGQELMIPLPQPGVPAALSAQALSRREVGNPSGSPDESASETGAAWENVQGVWFRSGSGSRPVLAAGRGERVQGGNNAQQTAPASSLARVVEVSDALRSTAARPVWIYMVGGARVEADDVTETADGAWYRRGNLSIFIERARIERIEREPVETASNPSPSWTERGWSTGNPKFDALIKESGARYGVDPYLIFCVMEQESQFKPRIVSPKGARGLMQLMPGTGARFGVRRPFDPAENIMGGTRYLKQLLEQFNGRVDLVLAGYNAGEGAVLKYGGSVPPYKETRNYVKRISARYAKGQTPAAAPAAVAAATSPLR
ncbi:MAG TPA: transglycosylase SLT domain-containing protein [Pyrinomonadaceae bacterium]